MPLPSHKILTERTVAVKHSLLIIVSFNSFTAQIRNKGSDKK